MVRRVRVPERFAKANMTGLAPLFEMVKGYGGAMLKSMPERGLLLMGPPGVGKTWAMAALTRFYVEAFNRDHEFVTAPDLIDRLTDFEDSHDAYRDKPWRAVYASVPWLVINDLGKEYRGGKLQEQAAYRLGRVLRARSEKKLLTHVTTNLTGDKLREEYGESIVSLLSEMVTVYSCGGKDQRKAKR